MHGHLLVSVSSIFDDTREQAAGLLKALGKEDIPVSLLVAPHIDGDWRLSKDTATREWLLERQEQGACIIVNGFDQAVQGRRAEFANLGAHEAKLRLKGASRQMDKLGFNTELFAPPRWRMSPGTLEVLPDFGFRLAVSTRGVHNLTNGEFYQTRNLSVGEGFGSAKWWRRNILRAAERGARRGNTVRLSISGRNLADKKVLSDFCKAAVKAAEAGATPADYRVFLD